MPVLINRLATVEADFEARFAALTDRAPESSLEVTARTAQIVEAIRTQDYPADVVVRLREHLCWRHHR